MFETTLRKISLSGPMLLIATAKTHKSVHLPYSRKLRIILQTWTMVLMQSMYTCTCRCTISVYIHSSFMQHACMHASTIPLHYSVFENPVMYFYTDRCVLMALRCLTLLFVPLKSKKLDDNLPYIMKVVPVSFDGKFISLNVTPFPVFPLSPFSEELHQEKRLKKKTTSLTLFYSKMKMNKLLLINIL